MEDPSFNYQQIVEKALQSLHPTMLKTVVLIGLSLANLLPERVEPYSPSGIDRTDDLDAQDGSGATVQQFFNNLLLRHKNITLLHFELEYFTVVKRLTPTKKYISHFKNEV